MKKKISILAFLLFFSSGILCAADYFWDLVNSLVRSDFRTTENIINQNYNSMTTQEKRLVMSFTLTYSRGANTLNVVNLLIIKNILPNSFDLYTAINNNQENATVQLLIQYGAAPNGEILLLSAEKQRFDLVRQFIQMGTDVNYKYPSTSSYADGMTALLHACKRGNFETVKMLVENGADINARALDGNTALSLTQNVNNSEIFYYLIEHGAVVIANNNPAPQSSGITSLLDSQTASFQTGTYRLYGGSNSMRLTGTATSGSVSYVNVTSNRVLNGFYRVSANVITISLEGYTFIYTVTSNDSFSGNGEVWTRVTN